MQAMLNFVVLGCLLTVASTNFLYKAVDHRYPDYIVDDPRVQCTTSGTFPHPADCMWYYRCVDRSHLGYYHVFFFHCEAGTIFLDELDQCVFGSGTSPPCVPDGGITESESKAPPTAPSTAAPTLPPPPTTTAPPPPPPPPTAAPIPSPEAPGPPGIPPTVKPTGSESTIKCNDCVTKQFCIAGREKSYKKVCSSCDFGDGLESKEEVCSGKTDPQLTDRGRCYSGDQLCPVTTPSKRSELQKPFTFQCSDFQTRPDVSDIRSLYCRNYHYCSPSGEFLESKNLCSNFFQCYKTWNGGWSSELTKCEGTHLYSFDLDECVPNPTGLELC